MSEHAVAAFRELRTRWFNKQLRSYAHEREWEDEDKTEERERRNDANQALFNKQTEEILAGKPRCVAPLGMDSVMMHVEEDEVDEEWLLQIGGINNNSPRLGFKFFDRNKPLSSFIVFPRVDNSRFQLEPIVTIGGVEIMRNPTRSQILILLGLLL